MLDIFGFSGEMAAALLVFFRTNCLAYLSRLSSGNTMLFFMIVLLLKYIKNMCLYYLYNMKEISYPELDEEVTVKINELGENCVYVELLKYNNLKGIIERGEISRRRIRSIPNMVRINNIEIIKVISVDKENNIIYLSRRQTEFKNILD